MLDYAITYESADDGRDVEVEWWAERGRERDGGRKSATCLSTNASYVGMLISLAACPDTHPFSRASSIFFSAFFLNNSICSFCLIVRFHSQISFNTLVPQVSRISYWRQGWQTTSNSWLSTPFSRNSRRTQAWCNRARLHSRLAGSHRVSVTNCDIDFLV